MSEMGYLDFARMLAAIEEAKVVDFVRYANRQLREDKELAALPFKDGWLIVLGGYADQAARVIDP